MTRENRLIFLVALTYCIYGASIYFNQGSFILPFPLNEPVIFIACMQFAWWKKNDRLPSILLVALGFLALLSSVYFWEIIFSTEKLVLFYETTWSDLFTLGFYNVLSILAIILTLRQVNLFSILVLANFLICISLGVIYFAPIFILIAYTLMLGSNIIAKNKRYYPIWALLLLLEGFKAIHLGV